MLAHIFQGISVAFSLLQDTLCLLSLGLREGPQKWQNPTAKLAESSGSGHCGFHDW